MTLTVVFITRDEELHIERAVRSVLSGGLADRVVVVDSGSSDSTVSIAQNLGCDVFFHEFSTHAAQFQWALDNTSISTDWVMRLDADEYIPAESAGAIVRALTEHEHIGVAGFMLPRYHVFLGREIRHGGRYPLYLTRIWRAGEATVEQRLMDEHIAVAGDVIHLNAPFVDDNLKGLSYFTTKHNSYASLEARQMMMEELLGEPASGVSIPLQARMKRRVRALTYERVPLGLRALLYFLWRYLVRWGFLDGARGTIYHVLQGFWYRYLVDAKIVELRGMLADCAPEKRKELIDFYK